MARREGFEPPTLRFEAQGALGAKRASFRSQRLGLRIASCCSVPRSSEQLDHSDPAITLRIYAPDEREDLGFLDFDRQDGEHHLTHDSDIA